MEVKMLTHKEDYTQPDKQLAFRISNVNQGTNSAVDGIIDLYKKEDRKVNSRVRAAGSQNELPTDTVRLELAEVETKIKNILQAIKFHEVDKLKNTTHEIKEGIHLRIYNVL